MTDFEHETTALLEKLSEEVNENLALRAAVGRMRAELIAFEECESELLGTIADLEEISDKYKSLVAPEAEAEDG